MGTARGEPEDDWANSAQTDGHEPCTDNPSEWSGRRRTQPNAGTDATEPAPTADASQSSSFSIAPNAVVGGRYRLDRLLGEGGMGVVWAAHHTVTRRPVALKFLKGCRDEASRRRLVREARAAGSVHHPGIVAVHDVIESDDGEPALVMDLLDGESLRSRLEREGSLSLLETAELIVALCGALGAAHAAGVIHRDLKPENLFRLEDGTMRVLDFGVAKIVALDPKTAQSVGTQSGELVGTPMFMSPEQVFGERDIDHRSDLWSLGLIAYECLTGQLPTASENIGQVLKTILTSRIKPLKLAAPDLPDEVCAIVDRMLSFDRAQRPWSAGEVGEVFARVGGLDAPSISAPRPRIDSRVSDPGSAVADDGAIRAASAQSGITKRPKSYARWGILAAVIVGGVGASLLVKQSSGPADRAQSSAPAPLAQTLTTTDAPVVTIPTAVDTRTGGAASSSPPATSAVSQHPVITAARAPSPAPATPSATVSASPPAPSASGLQAKIVKTAPF